MIAHVFTGPNEPLVCVPQSRSPLPSGSVRVRMRCCTLCASDVATYTGRRREAVPTILGHEGVGIIDEFGPEAPRIDAAGAPLAVGDRVTWALVAACGDCAYCTRGLPQKCVRGHKYGHHATTMNHPDGGSLADLLTLVRGTAIYRVPDAVSTPVAALANCAAATAAAVLDAAGPIADRTVAIFGAGVLGLMACAMAATRGATVIGIDPDAACRERALVFGATQTMLALKQGDLSVDVALELAGRSETAAQCLEVVGIGGTVVFAGTASPTPPVPLDPQAVVRRLLTIRGVHNYHPNHLRATLEFLAENRYPFESLVAATFPLADTTAAFAATSAYRGRRVAVMIGDAS